MTSYSIFHDFDTSEPPTPPNPDWTRFVCISDTHSSTRAFVPDGDVLIHAGDLSSYGYAAQLKKTLDWISTMSHRHKIIVAGNHDFCLDSSLITEEEYPAGAYTSAEELHSASSLVKLAAQYGVTYLEHSSIEIESRGKTWNIYGSPSSPVHSDGAFQYLRGNDATRLYERVPEDTEIFITHTPPRGILDRTKRWRHAGCDELLGRCRQLRNLRLHVFGHIHEARGVEVIQQGKKDSKNTLPHYIAANASVSKADKAIIVDLLK